MGTVKLPIASNSLADPVQLQTATDYLRQVIQPVPSIAIVLGSGLGYFAEQIEVRVSIETHTIPHYPRPTVEGHAGRLVVGACGGVPLLAIQGRSHLYEGRSIAEVTFYVQLLAKLNFRGLILTNAAGGVNPALRPGDFVVLEDFISFTQIDLLPDGQRPDSAPFSPRLRDIAQNVARESGINLPSGKYCWTLGPSYETPAEIIAIRQLGASVVGMSTVPEAVIARTLGLEVLGISLVTNMAAGISTVPLSHAEVQATADRSKVLYSRLMQGIIRHLGTIYSIER